MKGKRLLSLVISAAMTLTAFSGFAVTSASAAVGDAANNIWTASAADDGKNANTVLYEGDKGTLTTMFDITATTTVKEGEEDVPVSETVGDRTFSAYVSHPSQNGGFNSDGTLRDGYMTLLSFVPKADGVLTVYFRNVGSTDPAANKKYACIVADKAQNYKTGGSLVFTAGSGVSMPISAELEANKTYYMFVDGSKGQFMAVDYEVGATYEQPTPTPVPTVDPNSKSWTASTLDIGRKAGDLLMGGLTLVSDNSSTNKAYVSAAESGKIDKNEETGEKVISGAALKFVAPADGVLSVTMINLSADKTPVIYGVTEKANVFEETTTAADSTVVLTADVVEGNTYYITATGTKGRFSAAKFTPAGEVVSTDTPTTDTPTTDTPTTDTPTTDTPATDKPAPVQGGISYDGTNVTVKADVTTGVLVYAQYANDALTSVKTYPLTFADSIAAQALAAAKDSKLMVWDSLEGMKPICDFYTVTGEEGKGDIPATDTPSTDTPSTDTPATTKPAESTVPSEEPEQDTAIFRADDAKVAALETGDWTDSKGSVKQGAITPSQNVGSWTVYEGWQLKKASNIEYTHTDGTKYTFTKCLYGGTGNTTSLAVSFLPTGTCKVTAVFDGTGSAGRKMNIAQGGRVIATADSVTSGVTTVSAEITDITEQVYVYGGGSNKNLYAVIVEYMEPETQADYVKEWDFQQVNYGKAEAVADGLVCNENTADQKNDGTNNKGFLTGANGGEIKIPIEPDKLDDNKVAVVKVTYNWDANFDMEGVKTYEQSQGGDNVAEYIYDASCANEGYITINTKGTTYIKEIDRTTLFKCPTKGTITSNSTKDLTGKNILFTDKNSGNVIKVPYGTNYSAELVNGRSYDISVEGMSDVCPTLETMSFTANVKIDTFNIVLMDIAETAITGEVVGLDSYSGVTLTFTNANDAQKTVNATITDAAEADTKNINPVTGTLSATLMPNNTYKITADGLPEGYSLSPLSQSYFMKAGDTKPFKNVLIVKDTPTVDYTTLADGTINVGPHGDYKTVNEAMAVVRKMTNRGTNRVTLNLEAGTTFTEQVIVDANNVTFVSDADNKATIQWYYGVGYLYYSANNGYYDRDLAVQKTEKNNITKWGCTVRVTGSGFLAENVNFDNTFNQQVLDAEIADGVEPAEPGTPQYSDGTGKCPERTKELDPKSKAATERAAAICVEGAKAEFYNCKFQSSQDTLYTGSSAAYFKQCDIYGMTDYIFGGNSVLFEDCNLIWEGYSTEDGSKGPYGGYITAVKTSSNTDNGYVFKNCTVEKNSDPVMKSAPGAWGRNWGGANCAVYFINTTIADGAEKPVGWNKMGGELSTSKLFVDKVYAAADTEKATDLTDDADNPNGAVAAGTIPEDMTVLGNWVPKHYEGARPEVTEYVTNWYFGKSNGASEYAAEGSSAAIISIAGENNAETSQTIKVDVTTGGKFNNAGRTDDWCQVNTGTKMTFPVVAGSVVTFGAYDDNFKVTIGETEFNRAGSYTVPAGVTSVTATVTNGGYMSYVKTVTPVANGKPADSEAQPTTGPISSAEPQTATSYKTTWHFDQDSGTAEYAIESNPKTGVITGTTEAIPAGATGAPESQQLTVSAENGGKFNNTGNTTRAQVNTNTEFILPLVNGSVINFVSTNSNKEAFKIGTKSFSAGEDFTYAGAGGDITVKVTAGGYLSGVSVISPMNPETYDPSQETPTHTVTYTISGEAVTGFVPKAPETVDEGTNITIPKNASVYKEGNTLTGWSDGTNIYSLGDEVAVNTDLTFIPVFTENTKTAVAEYTVKWEFNTKNGFPTDTTWQGKSGIFVAQAAIDGETQDIKLDVDATSGKFYVRENDAQTNEGTKFVVPAVVGSVITFDASDDTTTYTIGTTTINRTSGSAETKSYTVTAEDISNGTVTLTNVGGRYTKYIQVTYPAASN